MTSRGGRKEQMPDGMNLRTASDARNLPERVADRLIVALDVPTASEAKRIIDELAGTVSFFKVGYWLQFENGLDDLISSIVDSGNRLFLDAKMFDIPETVSQAVKSAVKRQASFVTIHG